MNKAINKRDRANTAFNSIDSETWKVMAKATENNYRINSKQVLRNGERGQSYLHYALSGPIGNTAVNLFDHHIIPVLIKLRIIAPVRLLISTHGLLLVINTKCEITNNEKVGDKSWR